MFQYNLKWMGILKQPDGTVRLVGKQPETWFAFEQSLNLT